MSVFKRKHSQVWYIALMRNGKRVQFSTGTSDYNEAKAIELAFKQRMGGGSREKFIALMDALMSGEEEAPRGKRHLVRQLPTTIAQLMEEERTQLVRISKRARVNTCHRFARWCAEHAPNCVFVDGVTADVAWSFISSIEGTTRTKQNVAGVLSATWGSLIRRGLTNENPWRYARPKVAPEECRTGRAFTPEEMGRILGAARAEPWLETAILIAVYTGLRKGDVFSLTWECVDLERGLIILTPSKTARFKRTVVLPIHPALARHLAGLERGGDGRVIGHEVTKNWGEWKACLERAGVRPEGRELMTFHNLRHTFATWVRQAGADKGEQMLLGGWSNVETSNRYDHATERLREVVGRLPTMD